MNLTEKIEELVKTSEGRKYKSPGNVTYLLDHMDALIAVAKAAHNYVKTFRHSEFCETRIASTIHDDGYKCTCGFESFKETLRKLGDVRGAN